MAFNLQDYETVESRLERFWHDHPEGRVFTDLVEHNGDQFVIKAFVYFVADSPTPTATGYAEESFTPKGVNQTSALENCETSAIGRALANCGYAAKGKRPSREEMSKTPDPLRTALAEKFSDPADRKFFVEGIIGRAVKNLSELTNEEKQAITLAMEGK